MIQPGNMHLNMTPAEIANFLGASAVALAEAFLQERQPVEQVLARLDTLCVGIAEATKTAPTRCEGALCEPVRLLVLATIFAAEAGDSKARWREIVASMIEYVRDECRLPKVPA